MDLCVVKVFRIMLKTKKKFLKLTKRPCVRNDYIPNEQRYILFSSSRAVKILFLFFTCEDSGVAMVTNMISQL